MNLVEIDRALRKLRLSGMADVLERPLSKAQPPSACLTSTSCPRSSATSCCAARTACSTAASSRPASATPASTLDSFDFDFNKKMNRAARLRARDRALRRAARGRALPRPAGHRQEPPRAGASAAPRSSKATASSTAKRTCCSRSSPTRTLDGTRKELIDRPRDRAAAHHRRPRHAQAAATAAEDLLELIMRRYERASHAPHLEPPGRRLGQAARRHRRRHRAARPPAPPRARPQVRPAQLAHDSRGKLAQGLQLEVRNHVPERLKVAGFQTITTGRF